MTQSVEAAPATRRFPPFAVCPVCGGLAVHDVTREVRGVMLADYLCGAGHGWLTKWLAAAEGQA